MYRSECVKNVCAYVQDVLLCDYPELFLDLSRSHCVSFVMIMHGEGCTRQVWSWN